MKLLSVQEKLGEKNLKIFTPFEFQQLFGLTKNATQKFLERNTKRGYFVRLKRGLYALKRHLPHEFVIANKLYSPSYISLDTALSYYHLIPETVYAVTSVTPKSTREFEVNGRLFEYRKIKKEAYTGYFPQKINEEIVYLAVPEKAVADFLYFVYLNKRSFNERLRKEKIKRAKLKQYLRLFSQKKLLSFVDKLFKQE